MIEPIATSKSSDNEVMDFKTLRKYGLSLLEKWTDSRWTDFNAHDPGITTLEQVCYAISDLSYRTQHPIEDLLAAPPTDSVPSSVFSAGEILSTCPVTEYDWRKLLIGIDGVQNAWIEPVTQPSPELHFHRENRQITQKQGELGETEPVFLQGIYRILIERSSSVDRDSVALQEEVYECVHANRALGEDFENITLLSQQEVQVNSVIDIGDVSDVEALLAEIYFAIHTYFSPSIPMYNLGEMLNDGHLIEDIMSGPLLRQGFIKDSDLQAAQRKTELRTSDIIQEIMAVPGVKGIKSISLASYSKQEQWVLALAENQTPRLDIANSKVTLVKNNLHITVDQQRLEQLFFEKQRDFAVSRTRKKQIQVDQAPKGRHRNLDEYMSIMHEFPDIFGVNATGLPANASPLRRAQVKQFRSYLLFFDQLLANQFAQLANARKLFSWQHERDSSYFSSLVKDDALSLHQCYRQGLSAQAERLQEITAYSTGEYLGENSEARNNARHNRFLDHLLARFAEEFTDYSLTLYGALSSEAQQDGIEELADNESSQNGYQTTSAKLLADKQAFLRDYAVISAGRGRAFNYLQTHSEDNMSGLELRLRRKLGITAGEEAFMLVEHILLRPMVDDKEQQTPLLGHSVLKDPYSLQVSFVFPDEVRRYQNAQFKKYVEQTIREETPAHLSVKIHWLAADAFSEFSTLYQNWVTKRAAFWQREA